MKYVNLENCVESIFFPETETRKRTLRKCNNYAREHGRDDIDYQFENGEAEVVFEFFDGIAIATDGSGLYMTYPTLDKVSKSKIMTERVEDYIGIYDDSISNHDIAMYYGVLKFSEGYFKATPDSKDDDPEWDDDPEYWQNKLDPEDFDDDPEWDDEPDDDPEEDDEPEGAPDDYIALIKKAADDITKASLQIAAMFSK